MLGNCEKNMVLIPSTTNEWTENNQIDEKGLIMASSAATTTITTRAMEKPNQDQQQQQPLKCPRCDSSNTKFCYYNNYSLSQPRHFCKACKRYWTRGGTLRNVPVGGGCRKNKRVKRPTTSATTTEVTINSSATTCTNPSVQTGRGQIDLSPSGSAPHIIDPLFYSLLTNNINSSDLNLPSSYPRFSSSRVSNIDFDPSPQMINGHGPIGLGFASGLLQGSSDVVVSSSNNNNSQLLSSYPSIFGSQSTTSSSLQQQQLMLGSYNEAGSLNMPKDVKMEDGHQNRMGWNINVSNNQNHNIEQINSSDAASSLLWNATGLGAWLDPASNIGSSVPSLI